MKCSVWPTSVPQKDVRYGGCVEIMYKSSEDVTKLPEIVIFNIFLPVI